jgi:hypothetical protein
MAILGFGFYSCRKEGFNVKFLIVHAVNFLTSWKPVFEIFKTVVLFRICIGMIEIGMFY